MAIVNATPDSFYGASRLQDDAVKRVGEFIAQGAEIIDVGGQSTRPGASPVGELEELGRVLPVVESVRAEFPDIPISVDTFFPEVAIACMRAGADMINDVSCLRDVDMAKTVAETGASVCVMHDRRRSAVDDLFFDKVLGLRAAVNKLLAAGVQRDRILLDGGIGFNRGSDEDWQLLNDYARLIEQFDEYPFLLGTSRKSMFGGKVEERLVPTLESTAQAVKSGVLFVRVHDVAENAQVIKAYGGR